MNKRYLITQSLLSSWNYMFDCFDGCEESAKEEFINTLRRIPKETTPEMQNGIDFENEVYKVTHGVQRNPHPKWETGIQAVAKEIMYAPNQIKISREMSSVCGMDLLIYGILDSLKCGTIYDVKFSNKSFGSAEVYGKYLNSPQHATYFYLVPEADTFKYLLSDGNDIYTETYTRANTKLLEELLHNFFNSLTDMGLMDVYKEHWITRC